MASEPSSRSSPAADSYIGSLISLTSKSEIRYEGVLYNINTDESSIGLKNVRSFGTEGRKKDGPQIPASDKIYEYILFRGSDIKDLQVKSSPPVQPTPTINNDPAIIQSHYSRPVSSSPSLPSSVSGSLTDINSHTAQFGLPGSNVQGGFPLYQPGGVLGSWGPSPPPNANGSGLHIPMYWQGYYGPANGLPHIPQQPPLLRPPPGMSIPSPMQQPMHYPGFNTSLPGAPSNLTEVPSSLLSASSASSSNLNSTSVFSSTLPSTLSSTIPPVSSTLPSTLSSTIPPVPSTLPSTLSSNVLPVSSTILASGTLLSGPNKAQNSALSTSNVSASLPSLSPLSASNPEMNPSATSISNKPNPVAGSTFPYQAVSQPLTSVVGTSSSSYTDTRAPSLVTPGQFMQSGSASVISSLSSQSAEKNEVFQVSSSLAEVSMPVSTEPQPPILPLPPSARAVHKPNEASFQPRHGYRGRGQGTGNSRPMTKFTEEFDFMAMNEKFNKDEVWGDLGKSNKSQPKDKDGDRKIIDDDDYQDDDDAEILKVEVKPVYNKDDFFDTLSSNALHQDSQTGRTRYSEQMKIDTETFGEFTRYHGGRGGRGPWRGGRSRGGYYGRGYGYVGRGRGRAQY